MISFDANKQISKISKPGSSSDIFQTQTEQTTHSIDKNTKINFATVRNPDAKIWAWTGLSLYEDDKLKQGPRRIQVLWNDLNEWIDDAFIMTYLCYIATISSSHVVVVDSLQIKQYPQGFSLNSSGDI